MKTVRVNYLAFHKYTLYIARIGADGVSKRESAPCKDCHHTLKLLGFRKLIYTTDNGIIQTRIDLITDTKKSWGRSTTQELSQSTMVHYSTGWNKTKKVND